MARRDHRSAHRRRVATLGSSVLPSLRATKVTPLEALQDTATVDAATTRRRTWIARGLFLLGVVAIVAGLFGGGSFDSALPLLGLGLILLFVGVAMLAGTIIRPLASLVGAPIERLRGITGGLARENTLRNPSRTATTSAALMIGVAVVFAFSSPARDEAVTTRSSDVHRRPDDPHTALPPIRLSRTAVIEVEGVGTVSPIAGTAARIDAKGGSVDVLVTGSNGDAAAVGSRLSKAPETRRSSAIAGDRRVAVRETMGSRSATSHRHPRPKRCSRDDRGTSATGPDPVPTMPSDPAAA